MGCSGGEGWEVIGGEGWLVFTCLQLASFPLCCPSLSGCWFWSAWREGKDSLSCGSSDLRWKELSVSSFWGLGTSKLPTLPGGLDLAWHRPSSLGHSLVMWSLLLCREVVNPC